MNYIKKTKIICTLGPATDDIGMIEKLIRAGMNVARVNFSHGTYQEQGERIAKLKKARENTHEAVALMLDTKGPEIRLKDFADHHVELKSGQEFTLSAEDCIGDQYKAAITYGDLYKQISPGSRILIDDGKVELEALNVEKKEILCTVRKGGEISDHKGINVPEASLELDFLSDADKSDILFGIEKGVDYIAASFVRREDDVVKLRRFLDEKGGDDIKIIAKIENSEGINDFDNILKSADGIMVARGDMGVEIDYEKIPDIQKEIIMRCCEEGKVAITATQMLESMIENTIPTRAEITDVANAVYDGTSAVMLSGETAVGKYPLETVEAMVRIVCRAEQHMPKGNTFRSLAVESGTREMDFSDVSNAVGHAACQAAEDLHAEAILAVTSSGFTAEKMSKYRPDVLIIAATPKEKTFYQQALAWGVNPIKTSWSTDLDTITKEAVDEAKKRNLIEKGGWIVISAGTPLHESRKTNMMKIERC